MPDLTRDRRDGTKPLPSASVQDRERLDGRRSLERLALMTVDQPPRSPYQDLDILSLAHSPARSRSKPSQRTSSGERNDFDAAGRRRPARAEENPEPLLL